MHGADAVRAFVEPGGFSSLNLGDEVMLRVALSRTYARWPGACMTVNTSDGPGLQRNFPGLHSSDPLGARVWSADLYWRRLPWLFGRGWRAARRRAPGVATAVADAVARSRGAAPNAASQYRRAVRNADLVLVAGSGAMTDAFPHRTGEVLATLSLAAGTRAVSAVVGQGIGPLARPGLLGLVAQTLPEVDVIALREGLFGPELLARAGVNLSRVTVTGDDTIEAAHARRAPQLGSDVGLNLRVATYSGVNRVEAQAIVAATRTFASGHAAELQQIVISRHAGETDEQHLGAPVESLDGDHFERCMSAVARCRVCVVGSYHAAVFALSAGVPVVAVVGSRYYAQKFAGLAAQFGSEGLVLVCAGTPTTAADVCAAAERLWQEAPRLRPSLLTEATRQVAASTASYDHVFDVVDHRRSQVLST